MRALGKAGFLFLSVLALAEVVLRIQEPWLHLIREGPNESLRTLILSSDNQRWLTWPRAHSSIEYPSREPQRFPPVVMRFNAQGCRRDEDLAIPKPPGLKRILILGDSFTQGSYNGQEDSAAARIEAALRQKDSGQRYEVVNCAFSAYSPILEYIRLRDQLIGLQPDAVIVNVDATDIYDDHWRYRSLATFGPDGEPLTVHRSGALLRRIKETGWYYSYVFRYLFFLVNHAESPDATAAPHENRAVQLAPGQRPDDPMIYFEGLSPESPAWKEAVDDCVGNVERIVHFLHQRGIPAAVTIYPHHEQLPGPDGAAPRWNRAFEFELAAVCDRLHIPFFSAWDGIAAATAKQGSLYFGNDMHFTPPGERIWSDLIASWWVANGPEAAGDDAR